MTATAASPGGSSRPSEWPHPPMPSFRLGPGPTPPPVPTPVRSSQSVPIATSTIASLVPTRVNMATYSAWRFRPARFILTPQEDEWSAAPQPLSHSPVAARAHHLGESGAPVYVAIFSSGARTHDPIGCGGPRQ